MTLQKARELQAVIKADGIYCVVPLGHGPDGYFCRIVNCDRGEVRLSSDDDWQEYLKWKEEFYPKRRKVRRPRNAMEALVDKACGIEPYDYEDE